MTCRCGSRPKCWKTMLNRRRRSSRSFSWLALRMSSPSSRTSPAVGSMRRVMQRTSVDLPLPDRPMTTKTSPGQTSNETSRRATIEPVLRAQLVPRQVGVRRADRSCARPARRPSTGRGRARVGVPVAAVTGGSLDGRGRRSLTSPSGRPAVGARSPAEPPRRCRAPCSARCVSPHGTRPDRSGQVPGRCRTA